MKGSGLQSKKPYAVSTAKDRTHHDGKKGDDERMFLRGIVAVGSEKHLQYNNLKKQLQKQKEDRNLNNKSSTGVQFAGTGGGNASGKRQARQQIVETFSVPLEEHVGPDENAKSREHDYSPLYKEFNAAGEAASHKKSKKPFTSLKDYTSAAEGRPDQISKQAITDSSLSDLNPTKKQQISQSNLSPQPAAVNSKRLRTQK